jgi:predicted DNA-binding transcriptional regulator AlpA
MHRAQLKESEMLRIEEISQILGMPVGTVDPLIKQGFLPPPTRKTPRPRLWDEVEIKPYLAAIRLRRDFRELSPSDALRLTKAILQSSEAADVVPEVFKLAA